MRAETAQERRHCYAIATCAVPVATVVVPASPLLLVYGQLRVVAVALALVVLVGAGLCVRFGRSAAAALFVGVVLGGFVALGGLLCVIWLGRLGLQ